jgi:HAD superfamily hydrolase (TIGR01549 family)
MNEIRNILWDFDGVILDSMTVREYGFRSIFSKFDKKLIDKLIIYHNENGGLSRFNKIKYFYNELLNQEINESEINLYADKFSQIMKKELTNKKYLIEDSVHFIKLNYKKYNFHIVSGSEHEELNYLCDKLDLSKYFISINGSPTHKNNIVSNLLEKESYNSIETILIGDSVNDYEASNKNNINFYGYNNKKLIATSFIYIDKFENFNLYASLKKDNL